MKKSNPTNTSNNPRRKILDVLIVGGGLSGMMVAHEIQRTLPSSVVWKLLEARDVLGGRLVNDNKGNRIDLGGAWVWPSHQPKIKAVLKQLKIPSFPQPDDDSSTRIDGGAVEIVHALAKDLPKDRILTNSPVIKCSLLPASSILSSDDEQGRSNDTNLIEVNTTNDNESFLARRVVLAAPPRLLHKHVQFEPQISQAKREALETSHTWMAGVTKVALVYQTRFWDSTVSNIGLPTHLGPAFQVYDSSTKDGSVTALTFFALVPPHSPANRDGKTLGNQVAKQIASVWDYFGRSDLSRKSQSYTDVHVQSWPTEKYISEDSEPSQIHPHPYPVRALSSDEWDGTLLFAGSESDLQAPGVMEGAVGAALRVVETLKPTFVPAS